MLSASTELEMPLVTSAKRATNTSRPLGLTLTQALLKCNCSPPSDEEFLMGQGLKAGNSTAITQYSRGSGVSETLPSSACQISQGEDKALGSAS